MYLDVSGKPHIDLSNVKALAQLSLRDMTATLMHSVKYFTSRHSLENLLGQRMSFLTIWVVTDIETDNGRNILQNALLHMVRDICILFLTNHTFIMTLVSIAEILVWHSRGLYSQHRRHQSRRQIQPQSIGMGCHADSLGWWRNKHRAQMAGSRVSRTWNSCRSQRFPRRNRTTNEITAHLLAACAPTQSITIYGYIQRQNLWSIEWWWALHHWRFCVGRTAEQSSSRR